MRSGEFMKTPAWVLLLCLGSGVGCDDNASDPGPPPARYAPTDTLLLSTGSPTKDEDPTVLRAADGSMFVAWFSDRADAGRYLRGPHFEQYPATVTEVTALPDGYSHRVAATPTAGVFLGAWVQGPEGAQDIHYRFFER